MFSGVGLLFIEPPGLEASRGALYLVIQQFRRAADFASQACHWFHHVMVPNATVKARIAFRYSEIAYLRESERFNASNLVPRRVTSKLNI
jgi:hypothetical protein